MKTKIQIEELVVVPGKVAARARILGGAVEPGMTFVDAHGHRFTVESLAFLPAAVWSQGVRLVTFSTAEAALSGGDVLDATEA